MVSGCGCKEVIDFIILLIPTPLVSVLFCSSIPTFCSFFYVFRSSYFTTILDSVTNPFCNLVQKKPNRSKY